MQHHHVTPQEWERLAADPEFQALLRRRRRFVVPATLFFIVFFLSLPLALGLAPSAMSRAVIGPLTAAYVFAFAQFAAAWVLLAAYLAHAAKFDRDAAGIVERARREFAA